MKAERTPSDGDSNATDGQAQILLFPGTAMNNSLRQINASGTRVTNEHLTEDLRVALSQKYGHLFSHAQRYWERHFAGKDPSDACVSVRISTGASRSWRS